MSDRVEVSGLAIKREKQRPLELANEVRITILGGIDGDCRGQGGSHRARQITLLSLDQWNTACDQVGISFPWHLRRANICLDFMAFSASDLGRRVRLGHEVILEITGETEPCKRMDQIYPGLKAALTPDWRGGVTCRVIRSGFVRLGNPFEFVD